MVYVLALGVLLLMFTALTVDMVLRRVSNETSTKTVFEAAQIAHSGLAQALVSIREAGVLEPKSGGGSEAQWVDFGQGQFLYSTTFDTSSNTSTIRGWGRVARSSSPSTSTVSPDDPLWDGSGWLLRGYEMSVLSERYLPDSPLYFGNGRGNDNRIAAQLNIRFELSSLFRVEFGLGKIERDRNKSTKIEWEVHDKNSFAV